VRLLAYGFTGPVIILAMLLALTGGGQTVVFTDDCHFEQAGGGLVYYTSVPVEATVPAYVRVSATVFAPPDSVEVEVRGERREPPLTFSLGPGETVMVNVYCSLEVASMPRAPIVVVEAGVEPWFSIAMIAVLIAVAGVTARGL